MGDVAHRQDAVDKKRFSDYFIEHHRSWLDFARGRDISLSDLILVDGCDKTSEWACAAWSEKTRSVKLNFVAGVPGVADGSAGLWGRWVSSQSLDKNIGPRPPIPSIGVGDTALQSPSSVQSVSPSTPQPLFNQCVFVRGFQMGDRSTFFKRKRTRIDVGNGFKGVPKPSKPQKAKNDSAAQHGSQQRFPSSTGGGESEHGSQDVEYFESDDEPLADIEVKFSNLPRCYGQYSDVELDEHPCRGHDRLYIQGLIVVNGGNVTTDT
jgi:hypothetical protein